MLLQLVRTGQYDLPGGTRVRDTTMTNVRTWNQLMRVEQQDPDLAEKENHPSQPDVVNLNPPVSQHRKNKVSGKILESLSLTNIMRQQKEKDD